MNTAYWKFKTLSYVKLFPFYWFFCETGLNGLWYTAKVITYDSHFCRGGRKWEGGGGTDSYSWVLGPN